MSNIRYLGKLTDTVASNQTTEYIQKFNLSEPLPTELSTERRLLFYLFKITSFAQLIMERQFFLHCWIYLLRLIRRTTTSCSTDFNPDIASREQLLIGFLLIFEAGQIVSALLELVQILTLSTSACLRAL